MNDFVIRKVGVKELEYAFKEFEYNGIEVIYGNNGTLKKTALQYAQMGDCWAGFRENKLIGCGGVIELYSHTGYLWLLMNKEARFYIKSILQFIKSFIFYLLAIKKFERLQCFCFADLTESYHLLEHLGFRCEGRLKKFYQGRDCFIYAKCKEE